jgi:hypothetical protein
VARVIVLILHPGPEPGAGPLGRAFEAIRRQAAEVHAAGFRAAGAEVIVESGVAGVPFGRRVRAAIERERPDGLVVLGSGSVPLARAVDRRAFVAVASGPAGVALANNRYSADVVAIAGAGVLARLPDLASDNGLPRWLEEAGVTVRDLRGRWRLQVDLDSPLDALLVAPARAARQLGSQGSGADLEPVRTAVAGVAAVTRDPDRELLVAGRSSAGTLANLERTTASRTRALIEERGFRTRRDGQRPVRSSLGLVLDRDGPEALGPLLAELGDAALLDSRVLIAHRFGADETRWPAAEDRFASDLLLPDRIADPWLQALTTSARQAPIPVVLGGHTVVGPGLRLVLARGQAWT